MTELEAFRAMLDRTYTGYGLRHDHDTGNTAVLVEPDGYKGEGNDTDELVKFLFNPNGQLLLVITCR